MRIKYLLEKIYTGKKVKFLEATIEAGPKKDNNVIIFEVLSSNKKFVLEASLTNFIRFKKWIGKEAYADYEPVMKIYKTSLGTFPSSKINTEVEITNDGNEYTDSQRNEIDFKSMDL